MLGGAPTQISGVDGCKAGWIAVTAGPNSFDKPEVNMFESVVALIGELAPRSIIGIDMPVGLPERAIKGGREPDWAAREFLRPYQSRIFPVPARRAVYAYEHGYAKVCATAQDTSDPPRKTSKQAFGIFPRIRQIDDILQQEPALRNRVYEVHPEVSFAVMNNNKPLTERKKDSQGMQIRATFPYLTE